jgi:hypothetical protein
MINYSEAQELSEIIGFINAIIMDNPQGYIKITPDFAAEVRRALEIANLVQYDIEAKLSGEEV